MSGQENSDCIPPLAPPGTITEVCGIRATGKTSLIITWMMQYLHSLSSIHSEDSDNKDELRSNTRQECYSVCYVAIRHPLLALSRLPKPSGGSASQTGLDGVECRIQQISVQTFEELHQILIYLASHQGALPQGGMIVLDGFSHSFPLLKKSIEPISSSTQNAVGVKMAQANECAARGSTKNNNKTTLNAKRKREELAEPSDPVPNNTPHLLNLDFEKSSRTLSQFLSKLHILTQRGQYRTILTNTLLPHYDEEARKYIISPFAPWSAFGIRDLTSTMTATVENRRANYRILLTRWASYGRPDTANDENDPPKGVTSKARILKHFLIPFRARREEGSTCPSDLLCCEEASNVITSEEIVTSMAGSKPLF